MSLLYLSPLYYNIILISARDINAKEDAEHITLSCLACGYFATKIRLVSPKTWSTLPRRPTDQSVVIDANKYIIHIQMSKGEEKHIRRLVWKSSSKDY